MCSFFVNLNFNVSEIVFIIFQFSVIILGAEGEGVPKFWEINISNKLTEKKIQRQNKYHTTFLLFVTTNIVVLGGFAHRCIGSTAGFYCNQGEAKGLKTSRRFVIPRTEKNWAWVRICIVFLGYSSAWSCVNSCSRIFESTNYDIFPDPFHFHVIPSSISLQIMEIFILFNHEKNIKEFKIIWMPV